ncbi:LysR family transcriptional regulator [Roseomonas sp. KE2513]|uniref:LysR family transcriptional regulator n=1 Tax=Roseomonas sp. KE2513 TaxID=2479202 RepID=UPI0018DF804C|nr:LysR family transcriptional regulator [Roseomonas sp. KE2513]
MDLRQIECFLRLYEEGSVTRAARRLHIVQPALSARIARMEADLGEQLFERSPQGMRATLAGHRAYEVFSPVLASFREAQRSFEQRSDSTSGRLTTGFVATVANSALAPSVSAFVARFPSVELTVFEGYSSLLYDWVRAQLLDFAVINDVVDDPELKTLPLLEEPFLLIGAAGADLPAGPALPQQLEGRRLVLPTKRHGLRLSIDRMTEREKLSLNVALEMDAMPAIGRLVEDPSWFTILPPTALGDLLGTGRLRAVRVAASGLQRRLVCAHGGRRPLSLAGHCFAEILGEELRRKSEDLLRRST